MENSVRTAVKARPREAREHREPCPFDDVGDHRGGKGEGREREPDGTAATEDRDSQGHPEEEIGEGVREVDRHGEGRWWNRDGVDQPRNAPDNVKKTLHYVMCSVHLLSSGHRFAWLRESEMLSPPGCH